ncbi:Large-conductance mechanosensitive channel [Thiomonas sp. X19]|uniref:large conductance mechanosensitive channel protein MscL n=1 Tax=Thiomonas sp. X19 TaxID=1050370 RepID=UPI000B6846D4|nr:large conductance mechanosensitive channel protein MscL [Thiomonas sp. X19]SCC95559.1 Large-conductance mechanosensitive channel [Thiomonas sp. X19]
MNLLTDFKEFAVKGNVIDLAVAVIIGGAFGKIVEALVGDIIMPVVGAIIGKIDFSNFFIPLGTVPAGTEMTLAALKKANVPVLAYGDFITIAINFLILAFIIFMMVRLISKLKRAQPPAPPAADPEEILLLRDIRDSLRR